MKQTRHHRLTAIIVVLLPVLLCLALLGANEAEVDSYGRPLAAIVNEDEIVTLSTGQQLPAGRQVIAALTAPQRETNFEWAVVGADTAEQGLKDGTYVALVRIPPEFSASVAGVLQSTSNHPGTLEVRTNGVSALLAEISSDVVNAAAKDLGTSFTVSYLSESLAASTQIRDGFMQASDGAGQLADGLTQASDGTDQIADGAAQLNSGTYQLASGLQQYMDGVSQAADGSVPLASGANDLASGVSQYVGGVQQIYAGITQPQPGAPMSLQQGAREMATNLENVRQIVHGNTEALNQYLPEDVLAAAQTIEGLNAQTQDLLARCTAEEPDTEACEQLIANAQMAVDTLTPIAEQLQSTIESYGSWEEFQASLTEPVDQLADGAIGLADGIDQVAGGLKQLNENGAALSAGAQQLADGTEQLADGLLELKRNAPLLTSGAWQLADGSSQLSSGVQQLAGGQHQLAKGAGQMRDQLRDAADQIPTYTRSEAERAARALGSPVEVNTEAAMVSARTALAPGLAALTLWLGSLAALTYLGVMTRKKMDSALTPMQLTVKLLLPATGLGALQSALVILGLAWSGVEIRHPFMLIFLVFFASATMMALNLAFSAIAGAKGGTIISVIFLGLQIVAINGLLPVSSSASLASTLHSALPVPQAQDAFTIAFTDIGSAAAAIWGLIAWLLFALIACWVAVAKRRAASLTEIRLDVTYRLRLAQK